MSQSNYYNIMMAGIVGRAVHYNIARISSFVQWGIRQTNHLASLSLPLSLSSLSSLSPSSVAHTFTHHSMPCILTN